MDRYLSRNRNKSVLTALIAVQFVLLAYQVRSPDARGIETIRRWSAEAILPVERVTQNLVGGARGWVAGYVDLRHARQDNQSLWRELGALKLENDQLREKVRELPQLDALLGFQRSYPVRTLPAQVISSGASADAQAIYLSRGEGAGLRRNMAVITPDGVVGKVSQVLSHSAQVMLVTDPDSGVGAMIGPTGVHGILHGLGAGRVEVRNVLKDEPTPNGAAVVTSGEDQVYPKGLPLGWVIGSKPSEDGVFKTVRIKLAADLGRLSEVLVVTGTLPPVENLPSSGLTAADIREQRLPSLPPPATNGNGSAKSKPANPPMIATPKPPSVAADAAQAPRNRTLTGAAPAARTDQSTGVAHPPFVSPPTAKP